MSDALQALDQQFGISGAGAPSQTAAPTAEPLNAGTPVGGDVLSALDHQFGIGGAKPSAPTTAETRSESTYGKQDMANDIALSIVDALPKGASSLFGSIGGVRDLGAKIADVIHEKLGISKPGMEPQSIIPNPVDYAPNPADVRKLVEKIAGQPLYEPQTAAGKYAGAATEGAAGMPFAKVVGAASGLGGQGGEDAAKALGLPSWLGRIVGSVVGALTPATVKSVVTSPEKSLAQANEIAGRDVLEQVGPGTETPTEIAPRIQSAAEKTVTQTRQAVNEVAQPYYDKSRAVSIAPDDWAGIKDNPAFQVALRQVRNDPILNASIKDLPDNTVGVLDVVKKHLDDLEKGASAPLTGEQRFKAGEIAKGAAATREAATRASPDYARALELGRTGRAEVVEPLERSPLGQLAIADDLKKQGAILFADNPAPGSEKQIGDAIRSIAAKDPEAAKMLVRSRLEQTFNEITQDIATGANQKGGAAFAAKVAGNSQQAKNLRSALEALPGGKDASDAFFNLLKIFKVQGESMAPGAIKEMIQHGGVIGQALKLAGTPIRNVAENVGYARNISRLADVMTNPESVKQLRQLAGINPSSEAAKALFASMMAQGHTSQEQGQ